MSGWEQIRTYERLIQKLSANNLATAAGLFLAQTFPPKLKDLQVDSSLPKRSIILGQNCDVDGSLAKLVATV